MTESPTSSDRLRATVLGASTAALVLVPTLGPVLAGTEEGADDFDTDITPPSYAFAIWGPIFASSAAGTIQHLTRPADPVNRRHGWWLAGAHATNALWSLAAQSGRFRYTAAILPVAAGLAAQAHRRLQPERGEDVPARAAGIAPHSTGLLLGWTAVASVVNVFAVRRRGRLAATTRTGRSAAAGAVLAAAGVLSAAVAAEKRGYVAIAAASGWALTTSALNPERTVRTRRANALGAALVIGTAAVKLARARAAREDEGPGPAGSTEESRRPGRANAGRLL
ncbi:hypothetical protein [Symbioplanes lichenis]|uniref:hypothetical protein n=1 Tax=Symbioplanes lichenis TaxID=1629072 RepID=UPI00273950F5|nr:hypothetical protein [Actinoplanes lichenis]